MPRINVEVLRRHPAIITVTALQAACAAYFLVDVLTELPGARTALLHPLIELLAVLALLVGSGFGVAAIRGILRENDRMQSRARAASGAFLDLMEDSFTRWGLTPSERDVALLSLKGVPVAEIADLRSTRVGTVKAQSAAVYRKAGVNSRAELMSLFMEDLMHGVVLDSAPHRSDDTPVPAAPSRSNVALQQGTP